MTQNTQESNSQDSCCESWLTAASQEATADAATEKCCFQKVSGLWLDETIQALWKHVIHLAYCFVSFSWSQWSPIVWNSFRL